ncbi:MAG: Sulfite exporter TauE/SafE [Candidatus Accumulibacter regalis]|uniref:Probable membrane transporter protein n=1 Tax=Accumulibacter regalis TaxID=522306 RepID=A0A011QM62_ACCRE|nr:sulfite exporter TauE/SafE family protein [Accumulibacter sp.]EXI90100.1 MAG: Sulfite exporter TauE/SafE [Candidatus Accumulibacter regalis]HRE71830.1 sulfite exporter TauE/SafE family protein [Accumulibacter sp.]HRE86523.1 sulfite exporter TauE/SafE family protein [Accumulibacter sp.]
MSDPLAITALIALTFVAAGFVKGVVGMGLPTVAIGVLSLVMAPASAAALLIAPSLVTNVWQSFAGAKFTTLVRRLASMLLTAVIGTLLSIDVLTGSSASLASGALGALLALYGVFALAARRFSVPANAERWLSPLVGLMTGLIAGATGLFAIPAVPYLSALGLAKDELVQALGLFFSVSTLALAAALALTGKYQWVTAGTSLLAIGPALLGMVIGQRVRDRLEPEAFRRWFFVGLSALGVYMLARALLRS